MYAWLATNWFSLVETAGLMASLLFSTAAFRNSTKVRRTEVALALSNAHRDIWRALSSDSELARVLDSMADLDSRPVTLKEEQFVLSVIVHLSTVVESIREGALSLPSGFEADIREFFALPVPKRVATTALDYQSPILQRFLRPFLK